MMDLGTEIEAADVSEELSGEALDREGARGFCCAGSMGVVSSR